MVERTVVLGHVVLDDVYAYDADAAPSTLGGAGAYAALGQALVLEDTAVVSGVGEDLGQGPLDLFSAAGVNTDGLVVLDPKTPRTRIEYFEDGEREETSVHGDAHFSRLDPRWHQVPKDYRDAEGIYVFDGLNPELWGDLAQVRANTGAQILWEIRSDICEPQNLQAITDQLRIVDILSINRTEATSLVGTTELQVALDELRGLVPVVVLRVGADGAYAANQETALHAKSSNHFPVVDPTGAGNAFSGAFLARWVQRAGSTAKSRAISGSPESSESQMDAALRAGTAAAAFTIAQRGAPDVNQKSRKKFNQVFKTVEVNEVASEPEKDGE